MFIQIDCNLIIEVMKMHFVIDEFVKLIHSLYMDYTISLLTNSLLISSISVHHGVLQSDRLTLLLFNLQINVLNNAIKVEKRLSYGCSSSITPKH